jgi:hypothetical protein
LHELVKAISNYLRQKAPKSEKDTREIESAPIFWPVLNDTTKKRRDWPKNGTLRVLPNGRHPRRRTRRILLTLEQLLSLKKGILHMGQGHRVAKNQPRLGPF